MTAASHQLSILLMVVYIWGFPGHSAVKKLPVMQETWVRSLDQEDPLEQGTPPVFSYTQYSVWSGVYPLQYSCLENAMDREALWATVHAVTQSQTQLK